MTEPISAEEYAQKFAANSRISGRGPLVTQHMPCPFCCEPDLMEYRVLEVEDAMGKGAVCEHCDRGIRAEFHRGDGDSVRFEIVQFCGPTCDAPWVEKLRRVDARPDWVDAAAPVGTACPAEGCGLPVGEVYEDRGINPIGCGAWQTKHRCEAGHVFVATHMTEEAAERLRAQS